MTEYENATLLFKAVGRKCSHWKDSQTAQRFLRRLSAETGRNVGDLSVSKEKGPGRGRPLTIVNMGVKNSERATLVHPAVAAEMRVYIAGLPPKRKTEGYVYAVTSPLAACVKIGSWRGTVENLWQRYQNCYGSDLDLYTAEVSDCRAEERKLHERFADANIELELFDPDRLEEYIDAIAALRGDLDA